MRGGGGEAGTRHEKGAVMKRLSVMEFGGSGRCERPGLTKFL